MFCLYSKLLPSHSSSSSSSSSLLSSFKKKSVFVVDEHLFIKSIFKNADFISIHICTHTKIVHLSCKVSKCLKFWFAKLSFMCIHIFHLPVLNLNTYFQFVKVKIPLGEDVSNRMQMGNSFVVFCSVYSLFALLSMKHKIA